MSVILYDSSLRTGVPPTKADLVFSTVEFDCVVRIEYASQSKVTRHPVEVKEALSDHSVPEPLSVSLVDAVVTNFPLLLPGEGLGGAISAGLSASNIGGVAQSLIEVETLAQQAYEQLEKWRKAGTPLELVEDWRHIDNLLIESVSDPRTSATANALVAQIKLTRVDIATSRLVNVSDTPGAQKNQGPKPKKAATPAEQSKGSAAYNSGLARPPGF